MSLMKPRRNTPDRAPVATGRTVSRRGLLGLGTLMASAAPFAAAHALSVVDAPPDVVQLYHSACGANAWHERALAAAEQVWREGGVAPDEAARRASEEPCPLCGCRLGLLATPARPAP